jgi:RNA polymerase sigma-70 factor (ECF subfamily)
MTDQEQLSEQFERHRLYLRAVAYRMLGSTSEAEDAVQESWLRLSRSDADSVANLRAWLTTVVGRVCVDMLRVRRWRREEYLGGAPSEPVVQVVADDDLRRVRRASPEQDADPALQRRIVDAFLAASRAGDLEALVAVLDPDIVFRVDLGPQASRRPPVRGADAVARQVLARGRPLAPLGRPAIVNGAPGVLVVSDGRPLAAVAFTVSNERIVAIDVVADAAKLRGLNG